MSERILDLTIDSPALGREGKVRLLLPEGWSKNSDKTWPVLFLLHGAREPADYKSWTEYTDVEQFMADKDVLTVLPTDGRIGFYTKWWNYGAENSVDWETFHVEEVRRIIEESYGASTVRAAAGLSIGGYGAVTYAYRHPGLFRAAASYSGMLHTMNPGTPEMIFAMIRQEGRDPLTLWGHMLAQYPIWHARNPYSNVELLRDIPLYVSAGNGLPGPLDPPDAANDRIEPLALATSRDFTDRLKALGAQVTTNYYGAGTHNWPYWQRELHASWPMLASALGVR